MREAAVIDVIVSLHALLSTDRDTVLPVPSLCTELHQVCEALKPSGTEDVGDVP
jgi:hypothetical protein